MDYKVFTFLPDNLKNRHTLVNVSFAKAITAF
jgi:hypothetical protein